MVTKKTDKEAKEEMVEEKIKKEKQPEDEDLLVPLEKYLQAGVHIGTKFKTKSMAPYIYKVNPNGLSVLNIQKINERIELAAKFLSNFEPQDILLVCRRENGWKAAKAFAKHTGSKVYTGRYPAGILTNPNLETFMEPKVMFVSDPWPDKNAVKDALKIGIPIVGLCDSNNTTDNLDLVVPCNNKGSKSLGIIFWIIANKYLDLRGTKSKKDLSINDFIDEQA